MEGPSQDRQGIDERIGRGLEIQSSSRLMSRQNYLLSLIICQTLIELCTTLAIIEIMKILFNILQPLLPRAYFIFELAILIQTGHFSITLLVGFVVAINVIFFDCRLHIKDFINKMMCVFDHEVQVPLTSIICDDFDESLRSSEQQQSTTRVPTRRANSDGSGQEMTFNDLKPATSEGRSSYPMLAQMVSTASGPKKFVPSLCSSQHTSEHTSGVTLDDDANTMPKKTLIDTATKQCNPDVGRDNEGSVQTRQCPIPTSFDDKLEEEFHSYAARAKNSPREIEEHPNASSNSESTLAMSSMKLERIEDIGQLLKQVTSLQLELNTVKTRLAFVNSEKNHLKVENETLKFCLDNQYTLLKNLQKELTSMKLGNEAQRESTKNENDSLTGQISSLKLSPDGRHALFQNVRKELECLKAENKLMQEMNNSTQQRQDKQHAIIDKLETVSSKVKHLASENENLRQSLNAEICHLIEQNSSLKLNQETQTTPLEGIQKELVYIKADNEFLQRRSNSLQQHQALFASIETSGLTNNLSLGQIGEKKVTLTDNVQSGSIILSEKLKEPEDSGSKESIESSNCLMAKTAQDQAITDATTIKNSPPLSKNADGQGCVQIKASDDNESSSVGKKEFIEEFSLLPDLSQTLQQQPPLSTVYKHSGGIIENNRYFLLNLHQLPQSIQNLTNLPDVDCMLENCTSDSIQLQDNSSWSEVSTSHCFQPQLSPLHKQQVDQPKQKVVVFKSLHEPVKLHETSNPWKNSQIITEDINTAADIDLSRKWRTLLNKLTPDNFQKLLNQFKQLNVDSEQRMESVIDLIYEKALLEQNFSTTYAKLCKHLAVIRVLCTKGDGRYVNFNKLLLAKCEMEFEKARCDQIQAVEGVKKEDKDVLQKRLAEDKIRNKRQIGNIIFLGELYKLDMLKWPVIREFIMKLIDQKDEKSLECVCVLLTTIGKMASSKRINEISRCFRIRLQNLDLYFAEIQDIVNLRKCSTRIRFLLQNLIELRQNNWMPRRSADTPKPIAQIHKEAEKG